MNDETTKDGPTIGETTGTEVPAGAERVGFCQDCGRPLSRETVRTVGSGVFCEPCLEARLTGTAAAAGPGTYTAGARPGYVGVDPVAVTGEPSPALAGLLGVIPGVGAMYNGQFAKGVIHLIIFAVLVSLADNVSGVFGLFVFAWICYQAFEAYHTAVARRDGLPLPNPFGFNEMGERMGFGKGWGSAYGKPRGPQAPAAAPVAAAAPGAAGWAAGTVPHGAGVPPPVSPAANWVGYVPPTAFGAGAVPPAQPPYVAPNFVAPTFAAPYTAPYTPPAYADPAYAAAAPAPADTMAADLRAQAMGGAAAPPPGYAETYVGPAAAAAYDPLTAPVLPGRRFPVGAFWLIGLGVLILVANLLPDWKLSERWLAPVLLAGFAVWLFTRRLRTGARIACIVRWPAVLLVLAVLLALHAAYFTVTFGLGAAVLLIVFGALLLVERLAGPAFAGPVGAGGYYAAPAPYAASESVAPAAAGPTVETPTAEDAAKGGQA